MIFPTVVVDDIGANAGGLILAAYFRLADDGTLRIRMAPDNSALPACPKQNGEKTQRAQKNEGALETNRSGIAPS